MAKRKRSVRQQPSVWVVEFSTRHEPHVWSQWSGGEVSTSTDWEKQAEEKLHALGKRFPQYHFRNAEYVRRLPQRRRKGKG